MTLTSTLLQLLLLRSSVRGMLVNAPQARRVEIARVGRGAEGSLTMWLSKSEWVRLVYKEGSDPRAIPLIRLLDKKATMAMRLVGTRLARIEVRTAAYERRFLIGEVVDIRTALPHAATPSSNADAKAYGGDADYFPQASYDRKRGIVGLAFPAYDGEYSSKVGISLSRERLYLTHFDYQESIQKNLCAVALQSRKAPRLARTPVVVGQRNRL